VKSKTLLIAAAALVAGVISSQAQTAVYSQNIVGYVNTPLTAGTLSVVSPSLDFDGTGTNNTISTVFPTNGVTVGDVVFAFNGASYDTLNYKTVGHGATAVTGWYLGSTLENSYPLNPGVAVFYSSVASETNTQVGNVILGTNIANAYVAKTAGGISLVGSVVPVSGGLTTTLGYNPSIGDVVFQYNGSGYNTYNYKAVGHGATAVTGWYLGSTLAEPQIPVGSGVWLQTATSTNWSQTLTVQ
jgi:hypothetical protein